MMTRRALACLAARDGDVDEARRYSVMLDEIDPPHRWIHSYRIFLQANIAAALGERELTMTLLRQAFQVARS